MIGLTTYVYFPKNCQTAKYAHSYIRKINLLRRKTSKQYFLYSKCSNDIQDGNEHFVESDIVVVLWHPPYLRFSYFVLTLKHELQNIISRFDTNHEIQKRKLFLSNAAQYFNCVESQHNLLFSLTDFKDVSRFRVVYHIEIFKQECVSLSLM